MARLRICIIGLEDYGMLTAERATKYIGGESVQHVLLARAWRKLGVDVSIIVFDHGQPREQEIDGIRAIAACGQHDGVPGLRFIHPRSTSILRAMRQADADVYYQSMAGYATGLTAWFCRRYDKHFVFRISSDAYCVPGRQLIRSSRDRKVYEYGLRRADLILAQTGYQRQLLRANYGLDSELANMAVEAVAHGAQNKDVDVLWVANLRPVKRPELTIELARRLPHLKFVVIGAGRGEDLERMRRADREIANFTFVGAVAYGAVGAYFDRARIFLNTSSLEGFPNTFLQAWIRGLPVVTFFDPDGLVAGRRLGMAVRDLDEMSHSLRELAAQDQMRDAIGRRAAAFAEDNYAASGVARRYVELFSGMSAPLQGREACGDADESPEPAERPS